MAKPWQCKVCHRTAAKRATLIYGRCPGSAARRWAQVAEASAASGKGMGVGHALVMTDHIVWCWRCGASACVRARHLTQPCPGNATGWMAQARQRLLLGLHPHSRVPLGGAAVALPGEVVPRELVNAIRAAEMSATKARAGRLQRDVGDDRHAVTATQGSAASMPAASDVHSVTQGRAASMPAASDDGTATQGRAASMPAASGSPTLERHAGFAAMLARVRAKVASSLQAQQQPQAGNEPPSVQHAASGQAVALPQQQHEPPSVHPSVETAAVAVVPGTTARRRCRFKQPG